MKHHRSFFSASFHRASYLLFLILIHSLYVITWVLKFFSPLLKKKNPSGDLILFPYAFIGSDGYIRRFLEYVPYLEKDGLSFYMCTLASDDEYSSAEQKGPASLYVFFIREYITRLKQVLMARNYKAAFVQRGLFPLYFDLKTPYLEKLLRSLNQNITIDYWDSVFFNQPSLIRKTVKYADKLSFSNDFLRQNFQYFHGKKLIFKIAVNLNKYKLKPDYDIKNEVRIFWTGLMHNIHFLKMKIPLLREIHKQTPVKLIVVCKEPVYDEVLPIENHLWTNDTFFDLLHDSDIGIYPELDSVNSRGKSTMKVMDYFSTGLPMVGAPYGLPAEAEHENHLLMAESDEDWMISIKRLINDYALREKLGKNGRKLIEDFYTLDSSYLTFKKIIFDE